MTTIPSGSTTAGEIARHLGATLLGNSSVRIDRLEVFDLAGPTSLTFVRSARFAKLWAGSKAGSALISKEIVSVAAPEGTSQPSGRALIVVPDADLALIQVLTLFSPRSAAPAPGVHATAVVDAAARVAPTAYIGPGCVVAAGASVGEGAHLIAQAYVGPGASIGADTTLHPGVRVLDRCAVGAHCVLHAGVVIGADGFGYRPDPAGKGLVKIPHIGNVVIHDHVEIGANSCIDRAKFASTTIGAGTKIDNLVQVAHNCMIGRCCVLCGGTMLAGSVTLGDGVMLGGQVGIADNVTVGAGARVGAKAG